MIKLRSARLKEGVAMETRIYNRFQAFGIHFGISFLIFIILASLIIFYWYPGFLFSTDGG